MSSDSQLGGRPLILSVDDEPDIHSVTRLSLKSMRFQDQKPKFLTADSGAEAVQCLRDNPSIAVILLDVVMESDTAGLDAVKAIREELGNHFVRIILRTGQPGQAPERETLDNYDIDGYLPKAGLTNSRLYASVRTAIKAWGELLQLERHRQGLNALQNLAVSVRSDAALEGVLDKVLETAMSLCPTELAVLGLETFESQGDPQSWMLYLSNAEGDQSGAAASAAAEVRAQRAKGLSEPGVLGEGYFVPFALHKSLGDGWIYLDKVKPDELATGMLPLLAAQASNALYANVAHRMLEADQGNFYEQMLV